ncbi:MAG TPA: hypothetical protein VGN28_01620 [Blastococcus sp.]|jgi:hypothetical protein|nr:hypothetical protein [Blastococcus sp.]
MQPPDVTPDELLPDEVAPDEEALAARWMSLREFDDVRAALQVRVPEDAWGRIVADEERGGWPAVVQEVFWMTPPVFHVMRVGGFTWADDAPAPEPVVLSHERIGFEQVEEFDYETDGTAGGSVTLTGSGRRLDLPVLLMLSHLPSDRKIAGRTEDQAPAP